MGAVAVLTVTVLRGQPQTGAARGPGQIITVGQAPAADSDNLVNRMLGSDELRVRLDRDDTLIPGRHMSSWRSTTKARGCGAATWPGNGTAPPPYRCSVPSIKASISTSRRCSTATPQRPGCKAWATRCSCRIGSRRRLRRTGIHGRVIAAGEQPQDRIQRRGGREPPAVGSPRRRCARALHKGVDGVCGTEQRRHGNDRRRRTAGGWWNPAVLLSGIEKEKAEW